MSSIDMNIKGGKSGSKANVASGSMVSELFIDGQSEDCTHNMEQILNLLFTLSTTCSQFTLYLSLSGLLRVISKGRL